MADIKQGNSAIRMVTYWGMLINIFLSILKCIVGIIVGSIALFADGVHSLSDFLTDIAVLVGIHLGAKEADMEHPFGHGRQETFATAVIALVLIVVGGAMIYKASMDIAKTHHTIGGQAVTISSSVIWIALLSVISKEALYQWTRLVAVHTHSSILYANAWHHRSDALSSVAVLFGAVSVKFGYPYGDQLAAIIVGLMIIVVGGNVISDCFGEFAERAVDKQTVRQIQGIIESERKILNWHQLRTRRVGREIFLDLHILVNPELTIAQAHEISEDLESSLQEQLTQPVNVIIHIEPDLPHLRREKKTADG